jgi:RNA polymerase sigma-70 factor (ECF subfamily)
MARAEDNGKREAFEREALPHLNALYNTAVHLTHSQADAQDLVQETMLRAYRFFHQYNKGTNCKAWLFRILRNTFINEYRRKSRRPLEVDLDRVETFQEVPETLFQRSELKTQEEELLQNLYDDEVNKALESIPESFREVLLLSDVEGLAYQEIADILDVPIGTVRSRLSRARREMRRSLTEYAIQHGVIKRGGVTGSSQESRHEKDAQGKVT